ncbi:MAG: type I secretion C-terminal target domain-containing protein [Rhodospirillaceae bacterium]|nr:MAG: type I secretion C-terminal target domain-containing protein [Rhodospirillaceae bacterium]
MPISTTAILATALVSTLGVNTHIDFNQYGYQNLPVVQSSLQYLGVRNVRDSGENIADLQSWASVAQATGVRFDDFMPEGSPAVVQYAFGLVNSLAAEGVLNAIEGGNEEDDVFAQSMGNSLTYTASLQQQIYALGQALGLPVINMSFGAGWTATNNWQGDYGAVGDLSVYTDYGNAHTYPLVGQGEDWTIQRLDGLAKLAASTRPVITTEIGWNENQGFAQSDIAKFVLNAAFDGWKDGNAKTYFYALYDDGGGKFGLMNQDGTPKPAGIALHNLTTLLADANVGAGSFTPTPLAYQFGGTIGGENTVLMQKSDGSYWLSVWDETDGSHPLTLTLPTAAAQVQLFDPLTSTNALQTIANTTSLTLSLADHPVLISVVPVTTVATAAAASAPNVITTTASNSTIAGNAGTTAIYVYGTGDTVTGGSGSDMIQAFKGANTIYGGSGTPTIQIAGSNNKVFVGSGTTSVADSGTNNTITLGKVGGGAADIYGYILSQGDTLDMRPLLAGTQWAGDTASLGNFLQVTNVNANTIIRVNPSGLSIGASYPVAVLHGYAYVTLSGLLPHMTL